MEIFNCTDDSSDDLNKAKHKFSNKKIILYIIIFLIIISSIFIIYLDYKKIQYIDSDIIYKNIFINNIDVGDLTYEEAFNKIEKTYFQLNEDKKIILTYKENFHEYSFSQFLPDLDIKTAVDTAFNYIKEGNIYERFIKIKNLKNKPFKIDLKYKYNLDTIKKEISKLSNKYNKDPINATMIKDNGHFVVKQGDIGYSINLEYLSQQIYDLLQNDKEGTIEIILDIVEPKYNESVFENAQNLIGTFSSRFKNAAIGRSENLSIASNKINMCIVYPDEIFSTNKILGSRTIKNGYKIAPVLIRGELIDGVGGGICQISTNLYMAALFAELDIIERHNHSRKVGYADYGFDATLSYDSMDLKFKNNTKKAIYIESYIKNNITTVNIYGEETRNPNRKISFKNELVKVVPALTKQIYEKDTSLLKGETVVKSNSSPGYVYNLYKIVSENGAEISKSIVNKSYYKPKATIIKYGV